MGIFDGESDEHVAKVMLWALGCFDELRNHGLVDGGRFRLTDEGRLQFEALRAAGFRPTQVELEAAVEMLMSNAAQ